MSSEFLCQDCLRVVVADSDAVWAADWAVWEGNHFCECGGDVCDCGGCLETIASLKADGLAGQFPEQKAAGMSWSAVHGLYVAPAYPEQVAASPFRLTGQRNQCPSCGELFNSNAAFDRHRTGVFGVDRRCMTVPEMRARGMAKNASGWWVTSLNDRFGGNEA